MQMLCSIKRSAEGNRAGAVLCGCVLYEKSRKEH